MSDLGRRRMVTGLLVAAILVIVGGSWLLAPRPASAGASAFTGTDSAATTLIESGGVTAWFHPIFTPGSAEVESGLFAAQAALGAGFFGYAVGRLRERHASRPALPPLEAHATHPAHAAHAAVAPAESVAGSTDAPDSTTRPPCR